MEINKSLYVSNRQDWRAWLEEHHTTETEVWLIYYKKRSNLPRIPYDDAVEEALCFGWIDSLIKRIDDSKYMQKFSPRRDSAQWSELNKRRVARLIKEGKMTPAGMAKVNFQITSDLYDSELKPKAEPALPDRALKAIQANPLAWENFQRLPPSQKKLYARWINSAKRLETQDRYIQEAITRLEQNRKLGIGQ